MRFKLLAGQHIQADPDWEPSEDDLKVFEATGKKPKAPSRVYNVGQVVESDTDLAEKFGPEKFQRLGERRGVPRRGARSDEGLDPSGREVPARKGVPAGVESRTPGDPSPEMMRKSPSVARPTGQVQTGFQEATGAPVGQPQSGPLDPEEDDEGEGEEEEEEVSQPKSPGQAAKDQPNLDRMSIKDLQAYAEQEEIDLKGAVRRDDILRTIRSAKK